MIKKDDVISRGEVSKVGDLDNHKKGMSPMRMVNPFKVNQDKNSKANKDNIIGRVDN